MYVQRHPLVIILVVQNTLSQQTRIQKIALASLANTLLAGHGTVLFVIVCIETSIGIICGCLPGCKPMFTKMFPSVFKRSTNANSYGNSLNKKPKQYSGNKSVDGQPFPFQIVKGEGFEVSYENGEGEWSRGTQSKLGTNSNTSANKSRDDDGDDLASDSSREWIMMQKNPGSKISQV
jgi:hypothetical protein